MCAITMLNKSFLQYWLYAAFPYCYALQRYLTENLPCACAGGEEQVPFSYTVLVDAQEITIQMYRHHVKYSVDGRELYQPCLSYDTVKDLESDIYLLLLPIVNMASCDYRSERVMPDLTRRLSETALPQEHVEEVAYDICLGLVDGNGAEDEPLWVIYDETQDNRYGAAWWPDVQELQLFMDDNLSNDCAGNFVPDKYIFVSSVEDIYCRARAELASWIAEHTQINQKS